ncbi:Ribonuclease H2 subunit C protein [Dioscorea alata]|uniref:Ribonuclease H2 subunit C protein n=1 Tax=Dioscorea alata TaxID=55571 RepID=A0ACB7VWT4_DIOAL|nr:Ribonuclease H2 subunit C protein [Dioscorea alata]
MEMENTRAGIAGTIDLRPGDAATVVDLTGNVHLLPCSIKRDGPCPVSDYFKPKSSDLVVDGLNVEEAFFRGRKMQGATVELPEGFQGFVLGKKKVEGRKRSEAMGGDSSCWESRAEFGNFTYWNHDTVPSKEDPILRCFHWFSIANALHKPVTAEELATTSIIVDQKTEPAQRK